MRCEPRGCRSADLAEFLQNAPLLAEPYRPHGALRARLALRRRPDLDEEIGDERHQPLGVDAVGRLAAEIGARLEDANLLGIAFAPERLGDVGIVGRPVETADLDVVAADDL